MGERQAHIVERLDGRSALPVELGYFPKLVHLGSFLPCWPGGSNVIRFSWRAHSTRRSASAGRRRAARQPAAEEPRQDAAGKRKADGQGEQARRK